MRPSLRPLPTAAVLAGLLLTGCSSGTPSAASPGAAGPVTAHPGAAAPSADPALAGALTQTQLKALLLQADDLPDLPQRTTYAGVEASTAAPPQLALCQEAPPTAPHQLANVLAKGGGVGQVQVFEVLQVYADPAGAAAAYEQASAAARTCTSYAAAGRTFAVEDLADVAVPGAERALHYRLTTPDVVGGDVRSLSLRGRDVVLVTGYGAPPAGQSLLDYQADVLRRATARLG